MIKFDCPYYKKCGGCNLLEYSYEEQLEIKKKEVAALLSPFCRLSNITGMKEPFHYRNKVHAVYTSDKKGNITCGVYEENSHKVVPVENCLIENEKAGEIIKTIKNMLPSFKLRTFDEDTGRGFFRHVLIRVGHVTGQIMVVLVVADNVFPSKNNFVKALRQKHPEITTIVMNVNNKRTSMVLGDRENVLYGKGYIEDVLCGHTFRISASSFYQINSVQTEILYNLAIDFAGLTGKERVIDAYCGIGTIGITAAPKAKEVIGVELNKAAVADAKLNANANNINNIKFFADDAGKYMTAMAAKGEHADVVFMDPPRSGSSEEFIKSVAKLAPERVVYISCGPDTQARDLKLFKKLGYTVKKAEAVDLFPGTKHVETVVLLSKGVVDKDNYRKVKVDFSLEDMD